MVVRLALNGAAHLATGAAFGTQAYLAYRRGVFGAGRDAAIQMPAPPETTRAADGPTNTDG